MELTQTATKTDDVTLVQTATRTEIQTDMVTVTQVSTLVQPTTFTSVYVSTDIVNNVRSDRVPLCLLPS